MTDIIGVDLGGTRIRAARFSDDLALISRADRLTQVEDGRDAVVARLIATIREVLPPAGEAVLGIGVACPGPLDPLTGTTFDPPNLPFGVLPLGDILREALALPVHIRNDADLAALAEHRLGAGQGTHTMVYVTISTGIGGGLIIDGKLHTGRGQGGEIGYLSIMPGDPASGPSRKGYLEHLSAGPALARAARERLATGEQSAILALAGGNLAAITGEMVGKAAEQGDALALEVVSQGARWLGIGIAGVMMLLHPEVVVIGGGVAQLGRLVFGPIEEAVQEFCINPVYWQGTPILPAQLGGEAGLIGAAILAREQATG